MGAISFTIKRFSQVIFKDANISASGDILRSASIFVSAKSLQRLLFSGKL